MRLPRITFGMIVLNGEPFVLYNLRSLYPFAHEIIVVEGAAPAARATVGADGHSVDGTLDALKRFQREEDSEGKLTIVTAEDERHLSGFWPGEKDEQSRAYAKRATGEYLWQVDVDEFYKPRDMEAVVRMLRDDPSITAVSFRQISFWGGFDYLVDGWYLRRGAEIFHRVFKWGEGYEYEKHRPPTVHNQQGQDLRTLHWVDGHTLAERGIVLHHYSLLFPRQVREKCAYYSRVDWAALGGMERWAQDAYGRLARPYRVHNAYEYPSWLMRFRGTHPPEIDSMRSDIAQGRVQVALRATEDVERLLRSPFYAIGRRMLTWMEPLAHLKPRVSRGLCRIASCAWQRICRGGALGQ